MLTGIDEGILGRIGVDTIRVMSVLPSFEMVSLFQMVLKWCQHLQSGVDTREL